MFVTADTGKVGGKLLGIVTTPAALPLAKLCPSIACVLPTADTGKVGGKLLGIVTTRDWDFVTDLHTPLSEIMTADIETAQYGEPGSDYLMRVGWWQLVQQAAERNYDLQHGDRADGA